MQGPADVSKLFQWGSPCKKKKKLFNLVKYHSVVFLCNFFVFLMFLMKTGSVCVFVSFMFCSRVSDIGNRPFLARQECGSTVSLYGEHGSWEHVWTKVWRIIFFGGGAFQNYVHPSFQQCRVIAPPALCGFLIYGEKGRSKWFKNLFRRLRRRLYSFLPRHKMQYFFTRKKPENAKKCKKCNLQGKKARKRKKNAKI